MLKRENFLFTIGYHGDTAIVDATSKRKYAKLNTIELALKGLFKPAVCSAIFNDSSQELEKIKEIYNEKSEEKIEVAENLKRVFGVNEIPEGIERILFI